MARMFGLLLALIAMLALSVGPAHAGPDPRQVLVWKAACEMKNKAALGAINAICSREFNTGSQWANTVRGIQLDNLALIGKEAELTSVLLQPHKIGNSAAMVRSRCHDGRFIPHVWCQSQFYQVCAEGGRRGWGNKDFDGGCQNFWIGRS